MSALARRIRQLPRRAWIVFTAALIAVVLGVAWLTSPPTQVSTDNAYLKADISYVAPRVHGLVASILVKDNQVVEAGQPLVRLDDTEYASRVRSAEADVAQAEAAVAASKAALDRSDAEESLARASWTEAQTAIASAESERDRANADRTRYEALAGQGWVPKQKLESASTTAVTANSNLGKTRAAALVAQNQVNVVVRRRAELEAAIKNAQATLARAQATLALAKQDEGDTVIRSPIAGVVGDRQIEAGEFVQPGTRLMAVVRNDALYVIANFKETQTERMLSGQPAQIYVDALPNDVIRGTVESLSPASGSEFALLPFEPGTGNFTKIVQRVPVRIKLTPGQVVLARLRPGLSVSATVVLDAEQQNHRIAAR